MDYEIKDGSNDRSYFALIPYLIVNHSDHWEQSLYLQMKRFAGESDNGTCFASQETLSKAMKVSQPTVSRTLKKLAQRGWIEEIGRKNGKTHPIVEYRIVDLWKLNMEMYSKKITEPQNKSSQNTKDSQTTEYKIAKPQNTEEETIGRRNIPPTEGTEEPEVTPNPTHLLLKESLSYFQSKTGVTFTNFAKQAMAAKKIGSAGYTIGQVKACIDWLLADSFWKTKGIDLMTVASQLPKWKMVNQRVSSNPDLPPGYKLATGKGER